MHFYLNTSSASNINIVAFLLACKCFHKNASQPFLLSVASRIGSRHTGQITEQSLSEHKGRLFSSEKKGKFSELESMFPSIVHQGIYFTELDFLHFV